MAQQYFCQVENVPTIRNETDPGEVMAYEVQPDESGVN